MRDDLARRIDTVTRHMSISEELPKQVPFEIFVDNEDGGHCYAIFNDGLELIEFNNLYPTLFEGYYVVNFDGYENAFYLGVLQ